MDGQTGLVLLLVAWAAASVVRRWWRHWRHREAGCPLCRSCARPAVGALETLSEAPRRR
ncbi:MAG: hypothetical protein IT204_09550 [Fimbriimonadaceae bacterium]|nr:hypothetical protein [Fimbriimonadaceae bacterium]